VNGVRAAVVLLLAGCAGPPARPVPFVPTSDYAPRELEGWTVHVNRGLLDASSVIGRQALRLLEIRLHEVARSVPLLACRELQRVPIWLGMDDGGEAAAEYYPGADWLRANGRNPDKAKAIEIGSAQRFLRNDRDQPQLLLHELAHAYHDRALGADHAGIREAYAAAKASGAYEAVLRADGRTVRAYALESGREYFAEGTEAYFGTNDHYPFVRAELERHDPALFRLLRELWGARD
jgi:hypothetical protein